MQLQALWIAAAETATDGLDFARRLEDAGVFVRIDPSVEPLAFRGAIEHVVRAKRVRKIGPDGRHHRRGRHPRRTA